MVSNNKKEFIIQKKKDLKNKCGSNPEIYSSGNVLSEEDFPEKMRIEIPLCIIEEDLCSQKK